MTPEQSAYQTVKKTLNAERVMRQRVFRQDATKLAVKLKEIDDALVSLDYLFQQDNTSPVASRTQLDLFQPPSPAHAGGLAGQCY